MGEQLTIPGEPLLAQRLREAAGRDALGHALILSGRPVLPLRLWSALAEAAPAGIASPAAR